MSNILIVEDEKLAGFDTHILTRGDIVIPWI